MRRRDILAAVGVGSIGGLAGCGGTAPTTGGGDGGGDKGESDADADTGTGTDNLPTNWPSGTYTDYDATTVTVQSPEGDDLGAVRAAIARTRDEQVLGLSAAPSLPENAGMLFVYPEPRESLTFVMREMDFGIDIVYADAAGTITGIHNASEPGPNEDGNEQRYPGSGQYVLEVPYKWTDRNGIEVDDSLAFEL